MIELLAEGSNRQSTVEWAKKAKKRFGKGKARKSVSLPAGVGCPVPSALGPISLDADAV
jgi:hypothetical protein